MDSKSVSQLLKNDMTSKSTKTFKYFRWIRERAQVFHRPCPLIDDLPT